MIVGLQDFDAAAARDFDLCAIGAGAAGITLARAFAGRDLRVCVIESGGLELDPTTQDLYRGSSIGQRQFPLHRSRLRYLGGTTNHWNGWCARQDPDDFAPDPWLGEPGWPFPLSSLEPFYDDASRILGLGTTRFARSDWEELSPQPPPLDPERLRLSAWRMDTPPTRFGAAFRTELDRARNVTVLLHANVTKLARVSTMPVLRHVEVTTLAGRRQRIAARHFVLAAGALENARLLLASNDVERAGLGNAHDRVGRTLMDHFQIILGHVHASTPGLRPFRRRIRKGRAPLILALRLAERIRREARLMNSAAYLGRPRTGDAGAHEREPPDLADRIAALLDDWFGEDSATDARRPEDSPQDVLRAYGNPVPNPESRVRLGSDRDALGMRRLELDWRLEDDDRRGLARLARTVGEELARLDAGRLRLAPWFREEASTTAWLEEVIGANHPMGTTRMAESPRHGVADADARVHGIGNLYIAGGSLFPRAGWANPTLTVLALTLRLADRLGREFGVAPVRIS